MLSVRDLVVNYDAHEVIKGVSVDVRDAEIVALLGSNGAGKTTLLLAICGLANVKKGVITLNNREIARGLATHKIARMGISLVPQQRWIFPDQTVLENLYLGAYFVKNKKENAENIKYVFGLFPRLEERKNQLAGFLSGGEQQMLSIARGLMSKPKILMLDEPSLGLAPLIIKHIFKTIRELRSEGMMILIVEQSVGVTLDISDRAYVMEIGEIILEGSSSEIRSNPKIIEAYLGI